MRGGFGLSHFFEQPSACNRLRQQMPLTIAQNFTAETHPKDWSRALMIDEPFAAIELGKPKTATESNAANPRL